MSCGCIGRNSGCGAVFRQSQQVERYVYELIEELKKKMKPSDAVHLEVTRPLPLL